MKESEELNGLKEDVKAINKKPAEMSDEEIEQISGGFAPAERRCPVCGTLLMWEVLDDDSEIYHCFSCGKIRYYWAEDHWEMDAT